MRSARPRRRRGGCALGLLIPAAACINITVPDTIRAGEATQVTVGFDTWKQPYHYEVIYDDYGWWDTVPVCRNPPDDAGCSSDALYEHYQLYLATDEFMSTCYLTNLLPIGETYPEIEIPKNLGPALSTYYIDVIEFNGTKMYMPYEGVNSSATFALADTDVDAWSTWELYGGWVKPADVLPCASYACYRECGLENSDGNGNMGDGKDLDFFACINQCDGIYADPNDFLGPWSWYRSWESDEDGYIVSSSISWKGWGSTTRYNSATSMDATATTLFGTPTDSPGFETGSGTAASPTAEGVNDGSAGMAVARQGGTVPVLLIGIAVALIPLL